MALIKIYEAALSDTEFIKEMKYVILAGSLDKLSAGEVDKMVVISFYVGWCVGKGKWHPNSEAFNAEEFLKAIEPKKDGLKYPKSIVKFNCVDRANQLHPTQKPIDLFRWLIKTYSNEGDTVFDGYSGSGTTAAACIKEKRRFIGSELNKEYYDLSVKRLTEMSMQTELF